MRLRERGRKMEDVEVEKNKKEEKKGRERR